MKTQQQVIAPVLPLLLNLRGYNIEISYSRSTNSRPQLIYTSQGKTQLFAGNDLQIEQTQVGQLVTASLTQDPAAEILESFTLLVPMLNLGSALPKSEILTTAILNQVAKKKGQAQTYMTLCLAGTAEQVDS